MEPEGPERPEDRAGSPAPPVIEVTAEGHDASVVTLRGEHDLNSRPAVAKALARAGERGNVLVDLSECGFVDSTIIAVLVASFQSISERGGRLELAIPADANAVQRVVQIAGLAAFMQIHETRGAGLASIR